jgi:hypothetical protein
MGRNRRRRSEEPEVQTAVRFPESVHAQLAAVAEERATSINVLVEHAARWILDHLPPIEPVSLSTKRILEEGGTVFCLWEWQTEAECPVHGGRIHRCQYVDDHPLGGDEVWRMSAGEATVVEGGPHACRCGSVMPS